MVLLRELVVLAQRVPDPVVGEQDVARIGKADERDAEHLGALALVELRGAIDRNGRRQLWLRLGKLALDREPLAVRQRQQVHVDPEVLVVGGRIGRRDVGENLEAQTLVVAADLEGLRPYEALSLPHDVPLRLGFSGGPAVTLDGLLVGVHTKTGMDSLIRRRSWLARPSPELIARLIEADR